MRSVLGIDAAWTAREPSGVSLIHEVGDGWRLVEVASPYAAFLREGRDADPIVRHRGSAPDAASLIAAANEKLGGRIDLVAVDIPLSLTPTVERRASDKMISSVHGARHANSHSPSATRPGIDATVSLCVSDHLPLSEPALAARAVLLEIVANMTARKHVGILAA